MFEKFLDTTVQSPLRYFYGNSDVEASGTAMYIFGAGGRGAAFGQYAQHVGCNVLGFIDNAPEKQGTTLNGLPVVGLHQIQDKDVPIVISSTHYLAIYSQLAEYGARNIYLDVSYALWNDSDPETLRGLRATLQAVFDGMADMDSSQVFASVVRSRMNLSPWMFPKSVYRQYDHPVVHAEAGDVILDCGAHIGLVSLRFMKQAEGRCTIHAFEPFYFSYSKLLATIFENKLEQGVFPVFSGVWSSTGIIDTLSVGNQVRWYIQQDTMRERNYITTTTIDEYVEKHGIKPTLIKMDIEGAEMEALRGARRTIASCRPKLMLSVYHEPQHLFEIPLFIKDLYPGYVMYLGKHSETYGEMVLYARP
jgi:FkbM family methyltransferase